MKQPPKKFAIECTACHRTIGNFLLWFEYGQQCPDCSSNQAEVVYDREFSENDELFSQALSHEEGCGDILISCP